MLGQGRERSPRLREVGVGRTLHWVRKAVCHVLLPDLKSHRGTSLVVQWLRLHAPNARSLGSIPGQGTRSHMPQLRVPRERNGNPLQYSCLENRMDRGARQATVHGVTQSQT